ncbi:MAG: iron-sulfur cluster assembly scaffold protein [bacterium]
MALKYSERVLEHFTNPQNVGDLPGADVVATEGSPACGDMITFALKINPETRVIEDIRFRSFGCASNIATASMATLLAKGKSVDEVKQMTHRDITVALGGLPAVKLHCSVLAIDALKAAIKRWEREQGLIGEEKVILDREAVKSALRKVIHPRTGEILNPEESIERLEIDGEEGTVFIGVKISSEDEKYAEALDEEIRERVGGICGVRKVVVQFRVWSEGTF